MTPTEIYQLVIYTMFIVMFLVISSGVVTAIIYFKNHKCISNARYDALIKRSFNKVDVEEDNNGNNVVGLVFKPDNGTEIPVYDGDLKFNTHGAYKDAILPILPKLEHNKRFNNVILGADGVCEDTGDIKDYSYCDNLNEKGVL